MVGLKRLFELALRYQDVADTVVGQRQVALPLHVAGVRRGKPFADDQAGPVGRERLIELALCPQDVADPVIHDRQIALPLRIVAVRAGEPLRTATRRGRP